MVELTVFNMAYSPSPGVMYTVAFPLAVTPVKYAFGTKVNISSVPASNGKASPFELTTAAAVLASAALVP